MKVLFVLSLLAVAALADFHSVCQEVKATNGATFDCEVRGRWATYTTEDVQVTLGTYLGVQNKVERKRFTAVTDLPDDFDSRQNWPGCGIDIVHDQGKCGSCWAVGGVTAATNRLNIVHNCSANITMSYEQVVSCAESDGCEGGWPQSTWEFIKETGLVSEECYPYELPPCHHPCGTPVATPRCKDTCKDGSPFKDRHYVKNVYGVGPSEKDIRQEIYTNGPIEAAFTVYEDFVNYKSGVYQHTSGGYLGGHAIAIIGWGVENDVPYWLVANSWNTDWGDNGLFKILRGKDECGIEDGCVAGDPVA